MSPAGPRANLAVIRPPYETLTPLAPAVPLDALEMRGCAIIWWIRDAATQQNEFDYLLEREIGIPLIIVLPAPSAAQRTLPLLHAARRLRPRAVIPAGIFDEPLQIRDVLSAPPKSMAEAATLYLVHRGILRSRSIQKEVQRIFELAPEVPSISKLARRMYTSRRSLGRHFAAHDLPVPSHWLQFGRLLHISVRLQNESGAIFRIAAKSGYPDGFTLSNQMKRLTGFRPTDIKRLLGWEWIIEAWIRREGLDRE